MLMKFDDIPLRDKLIVNVFLIEIENVGGWILKFRKSGVIINNRSSIPPGITSYTTQYTP